MSQARRALFTALLALPLLCGCTVWKKVTGVFHSDVVEPPPSPYPKDLQFDDLPVPQGLEHDRERSFAYRHGNTRSAVMRYSGNVAADDVVDFYRRELPRYQWELGMVIGEREDRKMKFEKASEICEISVVLLKGITYLTIRLEHK